MKRKLSLLAACLLMCVSTTMATVNIIPKPTSLVEKEGEFVFTKGFTIGYNNTSLEPAATYLQELLTRDTGLNFKTRLGKGKIQLYLVLPDDNDESYELVSNKKGVLITAHSYRGIINGIATLRQLLPPVVKVQYDVPAVTIKDSPNFHWRGLMLDPVRHFFSVEETKKLLDEMALYKLNKFHWHLSDTEGFRM
ncbi:MAG: family 20 glycosylhydrolase [Bacteroidaceae bacterium]|nr:family 20 glycosylhydrolase [Bacteroidaceae bacterium]